jgi:hypothetical protein
VLRMKIAMTMMAEAEVLGVETTGAKKKIKI